MNRECSSYPWPETPVLVAVEHDKDAPALNTKANRIMDVLQVHIISYKGLYRRDIRESTAKMQSLEDQFCLGFLHEQPRHDA